VQWYDGPIASPRNCQQVKPSGRTRFWGKTSLYRVAFIATDAANADQAYKDMIVDSGANRISCKFLVVYRCLGQTTLKGRPECGMEPDNLRKGRCRR